MVKLGEPKSQSREEIEAKLNEPGNGGRVGSWLLGMDAPESMSASKCENLQVSYWSWKHWKEICCKSAAQVPRKTPGLSMLQSEKFDFRIKLEKNANMNCELVTKRLNRIQCTFWSTVELIWVGWRWGEPCYIIYR